MRKRCWLVAMLGLSVLIGLGGCAKKTPTEQLLRDTIDKMQAAGEARDISGVMEFVADDFSGQSGAMDRRALSVFLTGIRMRTENIGVTRAKTNVTMQGERASVEIGMLVTDGGKLLPAAGQVVSAQTTWRFVSGEWELANAQWTEGF
jgi:hypothetical protein